MSEYVHMYRRKANAVDSVEQCPRRVSCPPRRRRPLKRSQHSEWPLPPPLLAHTGSPSLSPSHRRLRTRLREAPQEPPPSRRPASSRRLPLYSPFSPSPSRFPSHVCRPPRGPRNSCRPSPPAVWNGHMGRGRTVTWVQRSRRRQATGPLQETERR